MRTAPEVPKLIAANPGLVAPAPRLFAAPSPMAGIQRAVRNSVKRQFNGGRSSSPIAGN
jgi:hypothetical protein